jgi:phosphoribosylaminoimidazole-succinocarboxamide synthase
MKMMMNTNFDDSRSFMDWNQLSKFDEDKKDDIKGEYLNTKSEFMMNLSMPMKFLLH